MRKYIFFLLFALPFRCGCHMEMAAPSLNWENFDADHIDKTRSKKGPLGDYNTIFWQNTKGSYTRQKLTNYVAAHGWKLIAYEELDSTSARLYNGIVGVIVDTLFNPANKNKTPPDWLKDGVKFYKFGFIRSSSDKKTPPKLFHSEVLVSPGESEMSVYPVMHDS